MRLQPVHARPRRSHRRLLASASILTLLTGVLGAPLAVGAHDGSVGNRGTTTVTRVGDAIAFSGRPAPAARIAAAAIAPGAANEIAEDPEHERPSGGGSTGGPTDAPRVDTSRVTSFNPGFRGFAGLTHFDQRYADDGNQFSLEPPDGAICAGADREVELVNNAIAVYDRQGNIVAGPVGVNEFFGYAPGIDRVNGGYGPFMGDIKCLFDPGTRRWFLESFNLSQDPETGDFTGQTSVDWAVSKTSDPTGDYTVFSIDSTHGDGTVPGHPGCPCLGDQPLIGVDANGFYISTNEFSFFGDEFNGAQLYAIDKVGLADAANGGRVPNAVWFDQIPLAGNQSYSVQPAPAPPNGRYERANGGTAYFLSALDFDSTFDDRIAVWAMTNTSSLRSRHPDVSLRSRVIDSEAYGLPPLAQQAPGDTPLRDAISLGFFGDPVDNAISPLDGGDDRMQSATYANGLLWGSLATAVKTDRRGSTHVGAAWFAVVPWWQGDTLRAAVVNQGYVSVKDQDVIFPGLALNASGQGLMAFTLTGADRHPSAAYVKLDRSGTGSVHLAAAGVGVQDGFSGYRLSPDEGDPRPRWGDYTGTAVDENGKVWFEAEYIAQSCTLDEFAGDTTCGGTRTLYGNWATFIGRLDP